MKIYFILCLFFAFSLNILPLKAISNPLNPAWDVKSCSVLIQKPDGKLEETTFIPKNAQVDGCFKWGWTSTTHPKNCPNWRENIRNACKTAFEKETSQSALSSFLKRLSNSQEQNIAFEGCIESYTPSGIMKPVDWSIKKIADALGSNAYKICSTEPDTIEPSKPAQEQQKPLEGTIKIEDTIKQVKDLEDQPSQLYLNKPKLPIPKSTSNLNIIS